MKIMLDNFIETTFRPAYQRALDLSHLQGLANSTVTSLVTIVISAVGLALIGVGVLDAWRALKGTSKDWGQAARGVGIIIIGAFILVFGLGGFQGLGSSWRGDITNTIQGGS